MPSWNVHLEAGNRVADKLKLSPKDRREFVFGCLLPDINNGYVNNPHVRKTHEETHYTYGTSTVQNFYNENREAIDAKDPIYSGYLFHLLTDRLFNKDFEKRIKGTPAEKLSEIELENLKHNDFWIYGLNFRYVPELFLDDMDALVKKANQIAPIEINTDDIMELVGIIRLDEINNTVRGKDYGLYTKKDFDGLLSNTCETFLKQPLEAT